MHRFSPVSPLPPMVPDPSARLASQSGASCESFARFQEGFPLPAQTSGRVTMGYLAEQAAPICLELKAGSELHSTEIVGGGGYSPERVVSQTDVWKGEALQVGDIEHFSADLKLHAFPNAELLGE